MHLERVLVSACLMGQPVRYHGGHELFDHAVLTRWADEGRIVQMCPEVEVGLSVPRPRAEIEAGQGGGAVLLKRAAVYDEHRWDVSGIYRRAAEKTVEVARSTGARIAILKDGSPSCGTSYIYDGSFSGARVSHAGVVAAALVTAGVSCFDPSRLDEAADLLARLQAGA